MVSMGFLGGRHRTPVLHTWESTIKQDQWLLHERSMSHNQQINEPTNWYTDVLGVVEEMQRLGMATRELELSRQTVAAPWVGCGHTMEPIVAD